MWNSPASGSCEFVGFGPVPDPFTNKRPFTSVLKTSIKELTVLPLIRLTLLSWQTAGWVSVLSDRFSFFLFILWLFLEFLPYPSVCKSHACLIFQFAAYLQSLHPKCAEKKTSFHMSQTHKHWKPVIRVLVHRHRHSRGDPEPPSWKNKTGGLGVGAQHINEQRRTKKITAARCPVSRGK